MSVQATCYKAKMAEKYDWALEATLLEDLPPEKDGTPQYRELVSGDLKRCFDYAATMTPEGRRKLHIETRSGDRIDAIELAEFFDEAAGARAVQKPIELP